MKNTVYEKFVLDQDMKILLIVMKKQRILLDNLYLKIVHNQPGSDIVYIDSDDQKKLNKLFYTININAYDRIILMTRMKYQLNQIRFIQTLPNLCVFDHDVCQNYIPGSKLFGKYSFYYGKIPWVKILTTGFQVSQKLQSENFDADFIPKFFDENIIKNYNKPREVEMAFIGSIERKVYSQRKLFLEKLSSIQPLKIIKTNSGPDYVNCLNKIKYFISADIGLGEYMIKNFEAMAAGCVLFAYNLGNDENSALGFKDMHNIVLYQSMDELIKKLDYLRSQDTLAKNIALNGQQHVENNFTTEITGRKVVSSLKKPMRKKIIQSFLGIKKYGWSEQEDNIKLDTSSF